MLKLTLQKLPHHKRWLRRGVFLKAVGPELEVAEALGGIIRELAHPTVSVW